MPPGRGTVGGEAPAQRSPGRGGAAVDGRPGRRGPGTTLGGRVMRCAHGGGGPAARSAGGCTPHAHRRRARRAARATRPSARYRRTRHGSIDRTEAAAAARSVGGAGLGRAARCHIRKGTVMSRAGAGRRRTKQARVADEEGRNGCCSRAGRRRARRLRRPGGRRRERRRATGLAVDDQRLPRLRQPLTGQRGRDVERARPPSMRATRSPTGPSGATRTPARRSPAPAARRWPATRRWPPPARRAVGTGRGRAVDEQPPPRAGDPPAPPRSGRLRQVARRRRPRAACGRRRVLDVVRGLGPGGSSGPSPLVRWPGPGLDGAPHPRRRATTSLTCCAPAEPATRPRPGCRSSCCSPPRRRVSQAAIDASTGQADASPAWSTSMSLSTASDLPGGGGGPDAAGRGHAAVVIPRQPAAGRCPRWGSPWRPTADR